jgi:hypothetical protein
LVLEFSLTASQIGLIGLDFVKTPANFRDFCAAIPRCWSSSTGLSAIIACPFPLAAISTLRSDAPDGLEKM